MRVRVTAYYGDGGKPLTKETKDYSLPLQDVDEQSFEEALDYLTEQVLEPYSTEGYDLEDDEDESSIGTDYLAAWLVPEWFEKKAEAKDFLKQLIKDTNLALADLE